MITSYAEYRSAVLESMRTSRKWSSQLDRLTSVCRDAHRKIGIDVHPRLLIETAMTESAMGTRKSPVSKSWWQIDPPSYRDAMASPKAFGIYIYRYQKKEIAEKVLGFHEGQMRNVLRANGLEPTVDDLMEVFRMHGKHIKKGRRTYNMLMRWCSYGSGTTKKRTLDFLQKYDLSQHKYAHLEKPEVGVMFALRHYYSALGEAKYIEVNGHGARDKRAWCWKRYFNTAAGKGTSAKYLAAVKYFYTISGVEDGYDQPSADAVAKNMGFRSTEVMTSVLRSAGVDKSVIAANLG